jgi:hypothetical protein
MALNLLACVPLLLTLGLILLGFASRQEIRRRWWIMSLVTFATALVDLVLLTALPILGLSFGKAAFPLAGMNSIRLVVLVIGLLLFSLPKSNHKLARLVTIGVIVTQCSLVALEFYGLYIEPFRLTVTRYQQESPAFFPDRPLRIIQLSDLHIERITIRERAMIERINELQPDIIVLTGDYINQEYLDDPLALEDARSVLSQLSAPYGVYAVSGTTDVNNIPSALFDGLDNVRLLRNEVVPLPLPGGTFFLVGVSINGDVNVDRQMLIDLLAEFPPDGYYVLLYHMPDLIETAAEHNLSLYFAGHTHGGQFRLPFYGALITFSDYGKKYEMGEYQVGSTTLYVSRGLGMEGLGMPRIRFLCPPEILLLELGE